MAVNNVEELGRIWKLENRSEKDDVILREEIGRIEDIIQKLVSNNKTMKKRFENFELELISDDDFSYEYNGPLMFNGSVTWETKGSNSWKGSFIDWYNKLETNLNEELSDYTISVVFDDYEGEDNLEIELTLKE